ncbi:MAG: glycosyltransferase [Oscillospiraceae bacterium]|nr:glycosyltransferase [Oscillospiraceae bacterium]
MEKEFELMYIEGRDADQRKPPYDEILASKPFSYRFKNRLKCLFPGIQRRYRRMRGYASAKYGELPVLPLSLANLRRLTYNDGFEGDTTSDECLVSILCTAYNHEAFLRDALDGFVNQRTRFRFEVLVNDDVSTDSTRDIIREYAEKYPDIIRPFYQEKNLYSQKLDVYHLVFYPNARGKYVAFCEGDDYWTDPTKLQRQVDWLEAHPEYSACVHNTVLHYCEDGRNELLLDRYEGSVDFAHIVPGMSGAYHTSSLVAKRGILSHAPDFYEVACKYDFGDYPDALWLRLNGKIHFIDRCMSVYRINSNASAWSAGVAGQYEKLRQFIVGKVEMLRAFRPHAPEEALPLVDRTILEREFELMYIEGRDREQRKPPYDRLLRAMPLGYRFKNWIKCSFPGIQRRYRKMRGYEN